MNGVRRVLYRLQEVKAAPADATIFVVEGEKDADNGAALGLVTTCNPDGGSKTQFGKPGKWRPEFSEALRGRNVAIIPDNDDVGRSHANTIANALARVRCHVRVVTLPVAQDGGDLTDWISAGGTREQLESLVADAPLHEAPPAPEPDRGGDSGVAYQHFYAYLPDHRYIHTPTGATWPAASVNAALPWPEGPTGKKIPPAVVLDQQRPVEQMTWLPGAAQIIRHQYVQEGGWIAHPDATVFNRYKPPIIEPGDPSGAQRWLDHVYFLYLDDVDHIINYLAYCAQHAGIKPNHALVLGGDPGIGKDTILQPMKYAVGPSNFREITAPQALEPNNDFLQSRILLISEARDGDKKVNPYVFYEQTKVYIAAPPDTLRINEKYIREYTIFNLVAVCITTNNRLNGLYLPAEDRRHFVAWSPIKQGHRLLTPKYFDGFYTYLANGGSRDVTAFLLARDLTGFNAKAPPPKTEAFWRMVNTNRSSEDAELCDLLDSLGNPAAVTLSRLADRAEVRGEARFAEWLKDRANRRAISHRLADCGYAAVRNSDAKDGMWRVNGKRETVYAKDALSVQQQLEAVKKLAEQ